MQNLAEQKIRDDQQIFSLQHFKLASEECKTEKAELKAEKTELKNNCKFQVTSIQELHRKLESQWNATCISETKELSNNLKFKIDENEELLIKLAQKEREINEKKDKISVLEKKISSLTEF